MGKLELMPSNKHQTSTLLLRLAPALVAAVIAAAASADVEAVPAGVCGRGSGAWTATATAAWVKRVSVTAGYGIGGCTGAAWVATLGAAQIYIWATAARSGKMPSPYKLFRPRDHLPLPAYTDGTRIAWTVRGRRVWVEAGPSASDRLPSAARLARLQRASMRRSG